MSNSKKDSKKYFIEKLNQKAFDVPEDFLIDLDLQLDKLEKERKVRGFWIFFLIACGIGISYFILLLNADNQKKDSMNTHIAAITNHSTLTKKKSDSTINTIQTYEPTYHHQPEGSSLLYADTEYPGKLSALQSRDDAEAIAITKRPELNNNFSVKNDSLNSPVNQSPAMEKNPVNQPMTLHTPPLGNGLKHNATDNENPKVNPGIHSAVENLYNDNPIDSIHAETGVLPPIHQYQLLPAKSSDEQQTELSLLKLKIVLPDSIIHKASVDTSAYSSGAKVKIDSSGVKHTSTKFIDLQLRAGMLQVHTSQRASTPEYDRWLKQSEAAVFSEKFGIQANLHLKKFGVSTGVFFTRFGEQSNYKLTQQVSGDSVFVSKINMVITFDPQTQAPDTTYVPEYDTVLVNRNYNQTYKVTNRFSRIVIPVCIGYSFKIASCSVFPRAGISFDILAEKKQGLYPTVQRDKMSFASSKKLAVSYSFELEVRRNFNPFFVFISPQFNSALTPSVSTNGLNRRYWSLGLQVGIGKFFF